MLQLELIESLEFHSVSGSQVVKDLVEHKEQWDAIISMPPREWPLQTLNELQNNRWSAESLYIRSSGVGDDALFRLAKSWIPIELKWLSDEDVLDLCASPVFPPPFRVLECWIGLKKVLASRL